LLIIKTTSPLEFYLEVLFSLVILGSKKFNATIDDKQTKSKLNKLEIEA